MTTRLGVVRDYRAEAWPSMDLCADQLLAQLPAVAPALTVTDLAPRFRRRTQRLPGVGARRAAFNADRLLNRHFDLPRAVRRQSAAFDFVHVVDHSYAQVVHAVPPGRAGVYCHDLDAFRSLLAPEAEPRPWWFRRLADRTLSGLRKAAVVFHSTAAVRSQLIDHEIVDASRLVSAPYGVSAEFAPETKTPTGVGRSPEAPYLLHVGSNIPRKRLDVLLDVFAGVRNRGPAVRLVQVGGPWPPDLLARIDRLGIGSFVTQVRGLSRWQLADLYRRAAAVLVTSEAEGFGLPVIEALACGAPVVASDLPVLREVGGPVVDYCPVANVPAWVAAVLRVTAGGTQQPAREGRVAHAARYSWREHARVIGETYLRLAAGLTPI